LRDDINFGCDGITALFMYVRYRETRFLEETGFLRCTSKKSGFEMAAKLVAELD
jgi:hypothetical protein